MVAWRASGTLHAGLLCTTVGFFVLGLVVRRRLRSRGMGLAYVAASLMLGFVAILSGTLRVALDGPWRGGMSPAQRTQLARLGRAVVLAAPFVFVFGGLFAAADAVFESRIRALVLLDASLLSHAVLFVVGAATACGVLWCGLVREREQLREPVLPSKKRIGASETAVILGAVAALFAVFVAIQIFYVFGGQSRVEESIGLTYAEYARRGFFELVAAAVLVVPLLLLVHWAGTQAARTSFLFRGSSVAIVALLLVIMASAIVRLDAYIDAYGLTETRLYAALFLGSLAVVSLWLAGSLWRDQRDRFVWGAIALAAFALVATAAINPDGTIAAINLDRVGDGQEFDPVHAAGLSADAVPGLVAALDELEAKDACLVARAMLQTWGSGSEDIRSWNWGRYSARRSVAEHRADLLAACQ